MEDFEMENDTFKPKIATLVFMDLESTGLPSDVGKRNVQITEMSLVAVDRSSFEMDENLRVLNKISLCVRPRSVISPFCMDITGLYNDVLQNQEEFDDSIPKLLEYFFRRLQRPICLLAHNGNKFDFPVLQAELNRLNYTLASDIVCVDTLVAFRSICNSKKQSEILKAERRSEEEKHASKHSDLHVAQPISDDDIDSILSKDLESFSGLETVLIDEDCHTSKPGENGIQPLENVKVQEITVDDCAINPNETKFLSSNLDSQTPEKLIIPSDINVNINHKRKRKIQDPTYTPQSAYKTKKRPVKKYIPAKRALFQEYDPASFEIHKISKFSLQNLYNHFFHENPPNSHYAEVDTISLSKVCQKINKDFLQWIDENYVSFSTINALW